MSSDIIAHASILKLNRIDIKALKIKDAYSLHRVVYGLFQDVRSESEKNSSVSSGILFADMGGDLDSRKILILSDRRPHLTPQFGEVQVKTVSADFLGFDKYAFETTVNPCRRNNKTGKILPVVKHEEIQEWFIDRAKQSWGFSISPHHLEIIRTGVQAFEKNGQTITHGSATLKGALTITDRDRFSSSFTQGIGRGRAFGFGLLQIVPLTSRQA
jgi:CRISPR system Cascade subunit CasE